MDANLDTELKGSAQLGIGAGGFNFKFKQNLATTCQTILISLCIHDFSVSIKQLKRFFFQLFNNNLK